MAICQRLCTKVITKIGSNFSKYSNVNDCPIRTLFAIGVRSLRICYFCINFSLQTAR
jgi:hypothetical protein